MPKRVTPIGKGRKSSIDYRYLTRPETGGKPSTDWASCHTASKAFKSDPFAKPINGFYLSNSDLSLIGLGLAPLSFAFTGPASAYWITANALFDSASTATGIAAAGALGALAGFIKPKPAQFTDFRKPCSENTGINF